jgi:arginyl-tRNA synthetase
MKEQIESLLKQALQSLFVKEQIDVPDSYQFTVEHPRDKTHGDFSSNIAMVYAKVFKIAPRVMAERIIAGLDVHANIAKIEIAGPGFINFTLNQAHLIQQLEGIWASPICGVHLEDNPKTIVVDYSSPNLAKEMHVGHLRSTIIGDAIARVLELKGYKVIRQNHVGDWGTQFGMLLAHFDDEAKAHSEKLKLHDLETFYKAAKSRFDAEPEFAERARRWVVTLQSGDQYSLEMWHNFIQLSLEHCQEIYARLGVSLQESDVRAESAYNDELPKIIALLQEKALLVKHDGAQCVFLPEFKGKNDEPLPIIVQKNDGGFLYASTDLAAIRYRHEQLHANRVLYVVDARQALHFQQVFALAHLAGFAPKSMQLEHISFGMVLDKSGRPYKSREGGVTKLADLLDEAERRAKSLIVSKVSDDYSQDEINQMAQVIGISSVKYADLSKNRTSDYIFDWDTMISFEGNTAPYLLYAFTRVNSVFAKANIDMYSLNAPIVLETQQEIDLAKQITLFPEIIDAVSQKATPHLICTYLFELAGLFSSFYEHCPILNNPLQDSRLILAALTAKVLKLGLSLLGIQTLKRM